MVNVRTFSMLTAKKIREEYRKDKNPTFTKYAKLYNSCPHVMRTLIYNITYYDPNYKPPNTLCHDGYIKRTEGVFRCRVCGCTFHANDINEPEYGKPFKKQAQADDCCRIAWEG